MIKCSKCNNEIKDTDLYFINHKNKDKFYICINCANTADQASKICDDLLLEKKKENAIIIEQSLQKYFKELDDLEYKANNIRKKIMAIFANKNDEFVYLLDSKSLIDYHTVDIKKYKFVKYKRNKSAVLYNPEKNKFLTVNKNNVFFTKKEACEEAIKILDRRISNCEYRIKDFEEVVEKIIGIKNEE